MSHLTNQELQEAVYLVDRKAFLHVKEAQEGGFSYAAFERDTKEQIAAGRIEADAVRDMTDPTHSPVIAARVLAIKAAGLDGFEAARVGLTTLQKFPTSDINRRATWESKTLPKNDIRIIDSNYNELFRVPDGGTIQVEYPDRAFSSVCNYIDDYHANISGEVYHICQFAEILERGNGVCRPDPEIAENRMMWALGRRHFLTVELKTTNWHYHLYDGQFNEIKSGTMRADGSPINEVRNRIVAENKLRHCSMRAVYSSPHLDRVTEWAAKERTQKRKSVLGQLSTVQAGSKESAAPSPAKKRSTYCR